MQLSPSLPQEHGRDPASLPVSPDSASPPSELGCCLTAFFHPLQTALRNEVADTDGGLALLQEYRMLGHSFCRELDGFLLASYSVGVRTWHFGTTGRRRKAAPSQAVTSLATFTTAVVNIPNPNISPSAFFPRRGILRRPPRQTPAILLPQRSEPSREGLGRKEKTF